MKLSSSHLEDAITTLNPLRQLTLQLRNLGLSSIDSLPTNYTAVDLSNNQLIEISLSQPVPISTLILNNNIELYKLESSNFPQLENLSLINCNFHLKDILQWNFPNLKHLFIVETPVSSIETHQLVIIRLIPSLITLNGERITQKQRDLAEKTPIPTEDKPATQSLIERLSKTNDIEEIEAIERMIKRNE